MSCCVLCCHIHHQHKRTSKFINTPVNPLVFIIEQWNFVVSVMKSCWKRPYIFFWLEVWGRHELDHPSIRHAFDEYIMHSWNASDNKHVCKNIFSWIRSYRHEWVDQRRLLFCNLIGRGVVTESDVSQSKSSTHDDAYFDWISEYQYGPMTLLI